MNVQPIDLTYELRQRVQLLLALGPVVPGFPVARELLNRRERHALRVVANGLALGPSCRSDAPAQVGQLRLGKARLKRTNGGLVAARLLPRILLSGDRAHFLRSFTGVGEGFHWTGNAPGTAGSVCERKTPEIGTSLACWMAFLSLRTKQPVRSAGRLRPQEPAREVEQKRPKTVPGRSYSRSVGLYGRPRSLLENCRKERCLRGDVRAFRSAAIRLTRTAAICSASCPTPAALRRRA